MSMTTNTIKHVKSIVSRAQRDLLKAIQQEALKILRQYPMATEYIQAMGIPSLTVVLRAQPFDLDVREGIQEITHNYIWQELEAAERSLLVNLNNSMKNLAQLHDCWSDCFDGSAAGKPMRFGKDGKLITRW